jgi:hypothetical protein
MALFQQRQQLAPHNAHAALMRRPQPPASAVAMAAPGVVNGAAETTGMAGGMAPYKNGDGNGNGNGTAGAPVANGDAHTLH